MRKKRKKIETYPASALYPGDLVKPVGEPYRDRKSGKLWRVDQRLSRGVSMLSVKDGFIWCLGAEEQVVIVHPGRARADHDPAEWKRIFIEAGGAVDG